MYTRNWNLTGVYPAMDSKEFENDMQTFEKHIGQLLETAADLPQLDSDSSTDIHAAAEQYATYIDSLSQVQQLGLQLSVFANCHSSADAGNASYRQVQGQIASLWARMNELDIHLRYSMKSWDWSQMQDIIAADNRLTEISFHIEELYQGSIHMMDLERETLASRLSVDGLSAWNRFYTRKSGELRIELMQEGALVKLSAGQVKLDHKDRSYRENAYHATAKAWTAVQDDMADALNHISGSRLTVQQAQGYTHYLDKPLQDNRLQRESLEAMWSAISARKSMLLPWFEYRAKKLGVEKLSWFDLAMPLNDAAPVYEFDSAMDKVIELFGSFDPAMGMYAAEAAKNGVIESEDRSGKRPGAFCTRFFAKKEQRVFMTFTGGLSSTRTLAHELGHGYHGHLLSELPFQYQHYVMSTAETASTFAEEILNNHLIENAATREEKLLMLDNNIKRAVTMLMNIHARFTFESEVYERRPSGELSAKELNALMEQCQRHAYLDQLENYDPLLWASKLHFYISGLSFYNFPYTFGYLFSTALYAIAETEGKSFVPKYHAILRDTGCKTTEAVILDNLGMDIRKEDFWNQSLDIIEQNVQLFLETAN